MRFKTKRDPLFVCLWLFFLLVANLVLLWPLLLDPQALTRTELVGIIVPDALVTLLLAWLALDISYVIREDLLFVKGGMFHSKIRYEDITRITRQPNIWLGYRLLFSRDAIEIHYRNGVLGSVVISPVDQERFIQELIRRNPSIQIADQS
ncbi:PH domain-containing protein [Paenibacillus phoenicis]|uniref:PH domain-containing protein n=1 Tax=Paenibacillus phoenicis TaxID=554117 RepID=A0ABU5PHA7_9BACL|nr:MULTISPECIES: PH domain-containing protein [Paenibacillus]EES74937.1 hypothetical protein POTG_00168 [Paenibacillus sp. oral taxon 786 str. D14]MCT2196468.1 PH domain-containing protein [Paenibacillus sp. p3-SID1389]MEA3569149.1 PH domain-containing protein [Paenibacillus phoenicis]